MTGSSHIIQQQDIEIQFESFSDGVGIQNEISDLFYEELLPKMEILFDEVAGEKHLVTIKSLEIDCGSLSTRYWKAELVEQTLRRLRQELITVHKKELQETQSELQDVKIYNAPDNFLFFLKKGYLPWNSRMHTIKEMEEMISEKIISKKVFAQKLKELFQTQSTAAERLVYNFSDDLFKKILEWLTESKKEELERIYLFLDKEKITPGQKKLIDSLLLKVFANDHQDPEQEFYSLLNDRYKNIEREKSMQEEEIAFIQKEKREKKNSLVEKVNERECVYIQNAGLIILHPFLPELFTRLELLVDKHWKDNYAQHTAVYVLEFLVSGKEDFPEFNLPLNKILCGMGIGEVLYPVEALSAYIRSECEELLSEVIRHWSILKNTSTDTLRETFLQRSGKLTSVDNGWLLNIEQKGVDVLLNSLPWGIGTIKLPWTNEKFYTEWI